MYEVFLGAAVASALWGAGLYWPKIIAWLAPKRAAVKTENDTHL